MVTTEYLIAFLLMTGCYAFMLWMLTQRLKEAEALASMLRDMISVAARICEARISPAGANFRSQENQIYVMRPCYSNLRIDDQCPTLLSLPANWSRLTHPCGWRWPQNSHSRTGACQRPSCVARRSAAGWTSDESAGDTIRPCAT